MISNILAHFMMKILGLFRLGFVNLEARLGGLKARLGSARYVFEKARCLKNAQNEPKINLINYSNCLSQPNIVRFSKFKSL